MLLLTYVPILSCVGKNVNNCLFFNQRFVYFSYSWLMIFVRVNQHSTLSVILLTQKHGILIHPSRPYALLHYRHALALLVGQSTCSHLTKSSACVMTEFSETAVLSNVVRTERLYFKCRPPRSSALPGVHRPCSVHQNSRGIGC